MNLSFYAEIDNLLDETYSLGNYINAGAGRYYHAAPKRNYYAVFRFSRIILKKNNKDTTLIVGCFLSVSGKPL